MCAYAFFEAIFGQVFLYRTTPIQRAMHGVVGAWVMFNVYFNYLMCVITRPGTTKDVSDQDLQQAVPPADRWCPACEKPKPPLTHHCSICNQCVLMMDHHCPWVNQCIGHYNYRYFYLFLLYLSIGCAWRGTLVQHAVFLDRFGYILVPKSWWPMPRPRTIVELRMGHKFHCMLALLLTASVWLAVTGMLVWHTYLTLTAAGSIEFVQNRIEAAECSKRGVAWRNIYDLGPMRNWQERFDARGRWWWALWCLPRLAKMRSTGYQHQLSRAAEALMARGYADAV